MNSLNSPKLLAEWKMQSIIFRIVVIIRNRYRIRFFLLNWYIFIINTNPIRYTQYFPKKFLILIMIYESIGHALSRCLVFPFSSRSLNSQFQSIWYFSYMMVSISSIQNDNTRLGAYNTNMLYKWLADSNILFIVLCCLSIGFCYYFIDYSNTSSSLLKSLS